MICTLKWNIGNKELWVKRFNSIKNCTLLQSYIYAKAVMPCYNQLSRWAIVEINGQEAGLVQIMEAGIFRNIIHAVIVDRGPLWFDGFGTIEHFKAFMDAYNGEFPKRFGRKRRFIPEMPESQQIDRIMMQNNFTKTNRPAYQTVQLDLTQDEDALRAGLKRTWRQRLVQAEKSPMTIEWDEEARVLPWFLKHYDLDKRKRGYDGPDVPVVEALGREFAVENNALIGIAKLENWPIAAILILCHGHGATYQIGWSTQDGRKQCAHHRLLWDALGRLRHKGVCSFDLGGVNDGSAATIKEFKTGMGGTLVRLAGLYT